MYKPVRPAGSVTGSTKSPSVPKVRWRTVGGLVPGAFTITLTLAIVTPVKLKLIRWPAVPLKVRVAFWPGTVVETVSGVPRTSVPVVSAGTT